MLQHPFVMQNLSHFRHVDSLKSKFVRKVFRPKVLYSKKIEKHKEISYKHSLFLININNTIWH